MNALGTGDITDNATLALNAVGDFDNAISGSGKVENRRRRAHAFRQQYYTGGTFDNAISGSGQVENPATTC